MDQIKALLVVLYQILFRPREFVAHAVAEGKLWRPLGALLALVAGIALLEQLTPIPSGRAAADLAVYEWHRVQAPFYLDGDRLVIPLTADEINRGIDEMFPPIDVFGEMMDILSDRPDVLELIDKQERSAPQENKPRIVDPEPLPPAFAGLDQLLRAYVWGESVEVEPTIYAAPSEWLYSKVSASAILSEFDAVLAYTTSGGSALQFALESRAGLRYASDVARHLTELDKPLRADPQSSVMSIDRPMGKLEEVLMEMHVVVFVAMYSALLWLLQRRRCSYLSCVAVGSCATCACVAGAWLSYNLCAAFLPLAISWVVSLVVSVSALGSWARRMLQQILPLSNVRALAMSGYALALSLPAFAFYEWAVVTYMLPLLDRA